METIGKIIFSIGLAVSSMFGFNQPETATTALGSFTPVQASQFTLSGAGITSAATTIQLTSFKLPDPARTPITMAMFGDIGYAVIEPQTNKIENITFTGVVQNANGTATLTGVTRGINFVSPYDASATRALSHAGGSYIILSNPAAFYGQQFMLANNISTSSIYSVVASTSPWRYDLVPAAHSAGTYVATTSEFASVALVNAVVGAGCSTSSSVVTGCVRLGTQLQSASSTFSTLTPTVLTTQYSTSSPYTTGLWTPITRNDGKLSPLFIATTSSDVYSFGGLFTHTASTTMTATTTIAASNVLSRALILNLIPYAFPSSQGSANTVLTNNGSGTLSWAASTGKQYSFATSSNMTTVAGAYATSTGFFTLPAGTVNASSTIDFKFTAGACNNSSGGGTCTIYLRDSTGATFASGVIGSGASGENNSGGTGQVLVVFNNSVSAQTSIGGTFYVDQGTPSTGSNSEIEGTSSVNFANAVSFAVVIQGNANTTAELKNYSIVITP